MYRPNPAKSLDLWFRQCVLSTPPILYGVVVLDALQFHLQNVVSPMFVKGNLCSIIYLFSCQQVDWTVLVN